MQIYASFSHYGFQLDLLWHSLQSNCEWFCTERKTHVCQSNLALYVIFIINLIFRINIHVSCSYLMCISFTLKMYSHDWYNFYSKYIHVRLYSAQTFHEKHWHYSCIEKVNRPVTDRLLSKPIFFIWGSG